MPPPFPPEKTVQAALMPLPEGGQYLAFVDTKGEIRDEEPMT